MEKKNNKNSSKINRRDFFKLAGAGTFASAAALYGCSGKNNRSDSESAALGEIPTDKMVYRTNPTTGDRVSLLGYGCMRWPTRKRADGNGDEVDQEAVNELIDYAIAHGVNYFDTSPVYVQGWSEKSTGIALKRHPREKFLIATKLSNFSNYTRENSIAMYRKSFEDLQVDYIDYYLLHSVGNGGIKTFPPFCCITTVASTKAIYPKAAEMRTIAKPAAPSSSVMTAAYRSSARQAIVQDATNATRTVLKASIYPKSYRK